jgi:hypothetical protein
VARAAVAWARRTRRAHVAWAIAWVTLAPVAGGIAASLLGNRHAASTRVAAFAVFTALMLCTPLVLWALSRVRVADVEAANLAVLADAAGTPAPPAEPVEIRMRRRPVLLVLLAIFGVGELMLSIWSFASGRGGSTPWLGLATAIMVAGLLGMNLYLQYGPPLAVVGPDGVELVRQRLGIGWPEIADTRPGLLVLARLVRRTCVIWEIPSIEEMSERLHLDGKQRRWLRQNSRLLHPPGIGFSIWLINPGAIEIVRASRAFAAQSRALAPPNGTG